MHYPILTVSSEALIAEQLGTKEKFWVSIPDSGSALFKIGREGTGENWCEVVVSRVCEVLNIPHAHYEFAMCGDRCGTISFSFLGVDDYLLHGNELLVGYTKHPIGGFYKVRDYSVRLVCKLIASGQLQVFPPKGVFSCAGVEVLSAVDYFVGYLMLDALVANQDRHQENWGMVVSPSKKIFLAPTYDHAAGLGRNETDKKREDILLTKDKGMQIQAYAKRARSPFYASENDKKPISTLDAFLESAKLHPLAGQFWKSKLMEVPDSCFEEIIYSVPVGLMSEVSKDFSLKLLLENKMRICGV